MSRTVRQRLAAVFAITSAAVLLIGCAPTDQGSTPTAAESSASTSESIATASPDTDTVDLETVDPSAFLLEGTPGVLNADGYWSGHYGFFTDASKVVRCDLYIFSGDSGGVNCAITLGNEASRSYVVPPEVSTDCDLIASNSSDGYSIGINFKVFESGTAGFTGCRLSQEQADPAILAATKVLGQSQLLAVETAYEMYACTVENGVASCSEASSGASIRFGTAVAEYQG